MTTLPMRLDLSPTFDVCKHVPPLIQPRNTQVLHWALPADVFHRRSFTKLRRTCIEKPQDSSIAQVYASEIKRIQLRDVSRKI